MNAATAISPPPPRDVDRPLSMSQRSLPYRQTRPSRLRIRVIAWLLAIDLVGILAGFGGGIALRHALYGGGNSLYPLVALIPLYFLVAINGDAYSRINLKRPIVAAGGGVRSLICALVAMMLIGFAFKVSDHLPRLVISIGFVLTAGLIAAGRFAFVRRFEAIVGGNPFMVILIHEADQPVPPGRFSAIVPARDYFDPDRHDPIMYDRLARTLQGAHRVVVACDPARRRAWAHMLKGAGIQGEIVIPELAQIAPLAIERHAEKCWTMVVATGPLGLADRAVKRAFDLAFAGTLTLLISPLLLLIALTIKIDSPGPVLFRQDRLGRGNEIFSIFKFRSMRADSADSAGHRSADRGDDRVTRIGRLIRATSLDELPQLFNVLVGDMSIVGPRPHALGSRAANKLFWDINPRYWHRHAAKPGMTGLAQVRGFRGATLVEADLANRLQADLEYLENWSLWRDVKLVLLTLRVMLHRNAF